MENKTEYVRERKEGQRKKVRGSNEKKRAERTRETESQRSREMKAE